MVFELIIESVLNNSELIIRLVLAVFLGGLIGFERELSYKPAGLRTHMLVALGAALFTIVSSNAFISDPARIASGIVAGIGFIGAGTIIAEGKKIQGVTTAASIWASAAMGLAIGSGMYLIGTVTSILIFIILILGNVDKYYK